MIRITEMLALVSAIVLLSAPAGAATSRHKHRKHHHSRRIYLSPEAEESLNNLPQVPLYCEFHSRPGIPKAWLVYDPRSNTLWTRHGTPRKTHVFHNLKIGVGLAPYGDDGVALIAFEDVPIVSFRLRSAHHGIAKLIEQIFDRDIDATWMYLPGGPTMIVDDGDCDIGRPDLLERHDFMNW